MEYGLTESELNKATSRPKSPPKQPVSLMFLVVAGKQTLSRSSSKVPAQGDESLDLGRKLEAFHILSFRAGISHILRFFGAL